VPKLKGQRLDVAELLLGQRHLGYKEVGGGLFGVIVKSDWYVCSTLPAAGTHTKKRVDLIIARKFSC
jgi:hypothetical protein